MTVGGSGFAMFWVAVVHMSVLVLVCGLNMQVGLDLVISLIDPYQGFIEKFSQGVGKIRYQNI